MTKRTYKRDSRTFLVVGATEAEVMQLRQDMPNWLWIEAPKGWPFNKETTPLAQSFQAIIIFARQNEEEPALDVCNHICDEKTMDGVPLLVAASRYQMVLANKVKRLPRGHFIFTPIEENTLLDRINEIKRVSR